MTNEEAIKYLRQLYPYGGHCWLDEQRTEAIAMAINALKEKSKLSSIERNGKDCKDDPVSDDFEEACNQMSEAARISKCEAGKPFFSDGDYKLGFKAGVNWQKQLMEKYRIAHCDNITNEQAEMESDFVLEHIAKNNRIPTFLDAIEYGMKLQKQKDDEMLTKRKEDDARADD